MMILTNGLTDTDDEGFLKVANNIVKRLKKSIPDIEIVSYERKSETTDTYLEVNKFLSDKSVRDLCKKHKDVLYIPFPTKKWVMALRAFLLSLYVERLRILLVLKTPLGLFSRLLLRLSRAQIIVLSRDAEVFYSKIVGKKRVSYIKSGIDTDKYYPVSAEKTAELKKKYGFDPDKKLILHVGHLNYGRNVSQLLKISGDYSVLLVTSTQTKSEQDTLLKEKLLAGGVRIMDTYIPDIEEIYQMSDLYFFPVVSSGHCIDVPLSCLEAAACDKPVVTTRYGEMREFDGKSGFYFLDSFEKESVNALIESALTDEKPDTRVSVMDYDWNKTVNDFCCDIL